MEKRLIDANALKVTKIVERKRKLFADGRIRKANDWTDVILLEDIENAPTIDAVEVDKYNELQHDNDVLKRLINCEWVDTEDVQKALGIDFSTGMRMFEFSRMAKWNPAPLNGQYIETKFRLKRRSDESDER